MVVGLVCAADLICPRGLNPAASSCGLGSDWILVDWSEPQTDISTKLLLQVWILDKGALKEHWDRRLLGRGVPPGQESSADAMGNDSWGRSLVPRGAGLPQVLVHRRLCRRNVLRRKASCGLAGLGCHFLNSMEKLPLEDPCLGEVLPCPSDRGFFYALLVVSNHGHKIHNTVFKFFSHDQQKNDKGTNIFLNIAPRYFYFIEA